MHNELLSIERKPPCNLHSLLSSSGLKSFPIRNFKFFFFLFHNDFFLRFSFGSGHSSQFPLMGHTSFAGGQSQFPLQFPFGSTTPNPPCSFPSLLISRGLNPLFKSVFSNFFFSLIRTALNGYTKCSNKNSNLSLIIFTLLSSV